jgi:hypothetical protein
METRNDPQLSLDFEAQGKNLVDDASKATASLVGRPQLQLVYSSGLSVQSSAEEGKGSKIIEGILSHARSLSW